MTKIWYDTEFLERGPDYPIQLVSIGMVRDDGAEYYAVSCEFDISAVRDHPWLGENVWPHLPTVDTSPPPALDGSHPDVALRSEIAYGVRDFVLSVPDPELWASYSDYDHVVTCQLFGTMAELPRGFPMFTRDIKDYSLHVGDPRWPEQVEPEHHVLHDARHACDVWKFLRGVELNATAAP